MMINEITKLAGKNRRRRRIGRGNGSGMGKTAGRGTKGAGARSGWSQRGMQEGGALPFYRRIPKRGFSNANFTQRYAVVNVGLLNETFDAGVHVTPALLAEKGLIRTSADAVKVLADGDLSKKLTVEAHKFSKAAEKKITDAGGQAKVLGATA